MNYLHGTDVIVGFDALASHYIVIRVNHVDVDKLKAAILAPPESAEASAAQMKRIASVLPLASGVVNGLPKLMLDVGLPFAQRAIKAYGIDATIMATNVPPSQGGRSKSEFLPGVVAGAIVGTGLFCGGRALYNKFKSK